MQGRSALQKVHGTDYNYGNCLNYPGYLISGSSIDWAFGEAKIPYSFGMELRPKDAAESIQQYPCRSCDAGFMLKEEEIIPTGQETWEFHRVAAEIIIREFVP